MALQVSSPATNQLLGIGQTNQQLPTYTNLQAADPNNQRAPADIQGSYPRLQTNPVRNIQLQRYFNDQGGPPVALLAGSALSRLLWDNTQNNSNSGNALVPFSPLNYTAINGLNYHVPAFNGNGFPPTPLVNPLPQIQKLPYLGIR